MKENLNWSDCVRMSTNATELQSYLRAKLVQLAGGDNTVAIRAIEALMQMDIEDRGSDFSDLTSEQLVEARRRAEQYLHEAGGKGDS